MSNEIEVTQADVAPGGAARLLLADEFDEGSLAAYIQSGGNPAIEANIAVRAIARLLAHSTPPREPTREMVEAGRALLARLDEMLPETRKRPTIAELEAILAAGNSGAIELKPDGSIHVAPRAEIEAFRAALDAAPQANSIAVGEEE